MDDARQIDSAQNLAHFLRGVTIGFLENQNLGGIVNGKSFLGKLSIDLTAENLRVGGERLNQFEAEIPAKHPRSGDVVTLNQILFWRTTDQIAIVHHRQRVALRNARGGGPLAVGGDKNVIAGIQIGFETSQFIGIIVPVHFKVQITLVHAAVGVETVHAQRQAVIPGGFVNRGGACQRQGAGAQETQEVVAILLEADRLVEFEGIGFAARVAFGGKIAGKAGNRQGFVTGHARFL